MQVLLVLLVLLVSVVRREQRVVLATQGLQGRLVVLVQMV